jgi:two-component system chemotaxis sensor kinase CheA
VRPFDRSLLQIFSGEQNEHIEHIRTLIETAAKAAPGGDPSAAGSSTIDELFRRAHTLKGAARAVGLEPTELLMHHMEELFSRCRAQGAGFSEPVVRALNQALDSAEDILAAAVADRALLDISGILAGLDALPLADARGSVTLPSRDREGAQPPPDAAQNKKRIARSAADRRRQLRDPSEAISIIFHPLLKCRCAEPFQRTSCPQTGVIMKPSKGPRLSRRRSG